MNAKLLSQSRNGDEMVIELSQSFLVYRWSRRYHGSCTVWHDVDTGRRAGTMTERCLADAWNHFRFIGVGVYVENIAECSRPIGY